MVLGRMTRPYFRDSRSDSSGLGGLVPGGISRSLEWPHLSAISKTETVAERTLVGQIAIHVIWTLERIEGPQVGWGHMGVAVK